MTDQVKRQFYLHEFRAITRAISNYKDLPMLINHIVEGLCRTFQFKGCSILLLEEREHQLVSVGSYGLSDNYLSKGTIVVDPSECALNLGKPILIEDIETDPRVQYPDAGLKEGITSIFSVPIKARGVNVGVLRMYHSETIHMHEDDVDSLCVLAELAGLVTENFGLKNFLDAVKMGMTNLPLRLLEGI